MVDREVVLVGAGYCYGLLTAFVLTALASAYGLGGGVVAWVITFALFVIVTPFWRRGTGDLSPEPDPVAHNSERGTSSEGRRALDSAATHDEVATYQTSGATRESSARPPSSPEHRVDEHAQHILNERRAERDRVTEFLKEPVSAPEGERGRVIAAPPLPELCVWPEVLLVAWTDYWRKGDGHFNPEGLRRFLSAQGCEAQVKDGADIGAADSLLIVEPPSGSEFFVLPSFTKPPRAVQDWFDDIGGGGLTRRTQTVHEVATGRWTTSGFEISKRGSVS